MRILHVVPSYIPAYRYGGPIRSVHGLCKALAARGHDVHVFTTNVDGDKDSDVPLGTPVDIDRVKVRYFPSRHLRRLYRAPEMKKVLNREIRDFDLAHLHSVFLWPTWAAAVASRRAHVPYVVAPRGMLVKELVRRKSMLAKSLWISLIDKRTLEWATAIHVTSKTEEYDISEFGFKLKKVVVVPNGVDIPFEDSYGNDVSSSISEIIGKGPYLLFLGRVNWKKGLDRLIPALKLIPGFRLIIAGNDEENYRPKLEEMARENGLDERVIFCGPVYDVDKNALFRNAEIFVLPSYSENFGIAVLEAMAAGCPVVVTPEVGVAKIVEDSGAGIVVDGKALQLGNALRELLLDCKRLKDMGELGKQVVAEKYTWSVVARQMETVYKECTS